MFLCTNWGGNTVMVMEQLGKNLEDLMMKGTNDIPSDSSKRPKPFSLKTVLMSGEQLVMCVLSYP